MSDTPDDDRIMLDRQDLTLDPEGFLDQPEEVEKAERAEEEPIGQHHVAKREQPLTDP